MSDLYTDELSEDMLEGDNARYNTDEGIVIADGGESEQYSDTPSSTRTYLSGAAVLGGGATLIYGALEGNTDLIAGGSAVTLLGAQQASSQYRDIKASLEE